MKSIPILISIVFLIFTLTTIQSENIYVAKLDLSDEINNDELLTFDSFVKHWHLMCSDSIVEIQQKSFENVNFIDCTEFELLEQCFENEPNFNFGNKKTMLNLDNKRKSTFKLN
jgi:hypothetical protein